MDGVLEDVVHFTAIFIVEILKKEGYLVTQRFILVQEKHQDIDYLTLDHEHAIENEVNEDKKGLLLDLA
jgi:hypothetical protein